LFRFHSVHGSTIKTIAAPDNAWSQPGGGAVEQKRPLPIISRQ